MGAIQQPVWGMENGIQIREQWHALKVSLSGIAHDYLRFVVIKIILSYNGMYIKVANCGHPMIDKLIGIVDYDDNNLPTEQGTTINFTCPPAMSFIGQNSITCLENGVWDPHPSSILCEKG
jgi:hypothetical protein